MKRNSKVIEISDDDDIVQEETPLPSANASPHISRNNLPEVSTEVPTVNPTYVALLEELKK